MELDIVDIVSMVGKPITIVIPSKIDIESYAFDFENRYYKKYGTTPKVKYTSYQCQKESNEDYIIDPLCYKLEIKKRDSVLDGLLREIENGKRNFGQFS